MGNNTSMDTSCYPFHQLVVQSSGLINNNLERSWNAFTGSNPGTSFDQSDEYEHGFLSNVSLYSPKVKVTANQLLYIVRPKSGAIIVDYYGPTECPIAGWEIAFRCGTEIETKIESPFLRKKFKKVLDRLKIGDQDRDKFRLAQFKFKPRPEVDRNESSCPNGASFPYGLEAVERIFEAWWFEHGKKMVNIFGYSLITSRQITTPLERLSFPVYEMQLAPYYPSDGHEGMTAAAWCYPDHNMPPISRLANTGSFVDNTRTHTAALCISRTQFWNEWFLKVVASIPLHVVFKDTTAFGRQGKPWEFLSFSVGSDLAKKVDAEPWWSSQRQRMIPSEYRWEAPHDDGGATPLNFRWRLTDSGCKKFNPYGWIKTGVFNEVWITYSMGERFTLRGHHTTNSKFQAAIEPCPVVEHFIDFTWDWEMLFELKEADDDGLLICSSLKYLRWSFRDDTQDATVGENFYSVSRRLYGKFQSLLETRCKAISSMLNESLKHQHTMYLPGEGLFTLYNPTFNKRGDMLAALDWLPDRKVRAATNDGVNVAAMCNEDDILEEPDLSSVQDLPKRQPLYVLDEDASPGVINTADFDDLSLNLLEADLNDILEGIREEDRDMAMERLVAMREAIRTADQEKEQVGEMSKEDGEVVAEQSPISEDPRSQRG